MKFRQKLEMPAAEFLDQRNIVNVRSFVIEIQAIAESLDETGRHKRVFQHKAKPRFPDCEQFRQRQAELRQAHIVFGLGGAGRGTKQKLVGVIDLEEAFVRDLESQARSGLEDKFAARAPDSFRNPAVRAERSGI